MAALGGNSSAQNRERHDRGGTGCHRQAGAQDRVPPYTRKKEDQPEEHGAKGDRKDEGGPRREPEVPFAEKRRVDHGDAPATGIEHEQRQERQTRAHASQGSRGRGTPRAGADDPESEEPGSRDGEQDGPRARHRTGIPVARLDESRPRAEDGVKTDRNIDVERPPPTDRLNDGCAESRPERGSSRLHG